MQKQPDIQGSILDRLIDHEPGLSSEPVQRHAGTLNSVRESVLRDLENLLNARKNIHPVPESDEQVKASILSYGTRDFTSDNPRCHSVRQQIRLEIERLLMQFEPRLKNVAVRFDNSENRERTLHFRISAILLADPVSAPITFDTSFDINSGAYFVLK